MRLFVAIELDERAKQGVTALQKRLAPGLTTGSAMMRWTKPDQIHLTLVFIGHVDASRAEAIAAACAPPIDLGPFEIGFGGIGVFPPRGAPTVLWLGLERGADEVIRVQRIVSDRLNRAGVELEKRPFRPHLTLARWKVSRSADADRARAADVGRAAIRTTAEAVTLFESRQSAGGSVYTPLMKALLSGG